MSAKFFDLMKYAATGIASPSMTGFDKLLALSIGGAAVQSITGVPPISFKGNGTPLISWSMLGKTVQNGTPTPDDPIDIQGVGDRTANLFDSTIYELVQISATAQRKGTNLGVLPQGTYTLNAVTSSPTQIYRTSKNGDTYNLETILTLPYTFTTDGVSEQIIRAAGQSGNSWADVGYTDIMLNLGSTALPYEPYGYKIQLTNAAQTVPVYLGQTQTVRRIKKLVLDGEEGWKLWAMPSGSSTQRFYMDISGTVSNLSLCSHFIRKDDNEDVPHFRFGGTAYNELVFYISNTIATAADFKSYLAAQYAAGTPVTVWYVLATPETAIVNEPLMKIGDYADELRSTEAQVAIPTVAGANTLTVGTTVQPSSMSITGKIKPVP